MLLDSEFEAFANDRPDFLPQKLLPKLLPKQLPTISKEKKWNNRSQKFFSLIYDRFSTQTSG